MDIYKKYINKGIDNVDSVVEKIVADLTEIRQREIQKALMKKQGLSSSDSFACELNENGDNKLNDPDVFRQIISDFENDQDDEIFLEGFHGDELIFFNLVCQEKGFKYKRISYNKVLITK